MSTSVSLGRMSKLDRTVEELGIVDLKAQKQNRVWIVAIKASHKKTVVTAVATGSEFSLALQAGIERLHELKMGGVNALPS